MSNYARIEGGLVAELFTPPDQFTIEECFNAELTWVDVSASPDVAPGWTATETDDVWSFSEPPPPPPPSPAEQAATELATRMAAGILLTSASLPVVDAIYALDSVSTGQIFQIGLFANQFGVFPSGSPKQRYPDITGTPHDFTVPVFIAFLRAVAPLVSAIETQAGVLAQGGTPDWPDQTATII